MESSKKSGGKKGIVHGVKNMLTKVRRVLVLLNLIFLLLE